MNENYDKLIEKYLRGELPDPKRKWVEDFFEIESSRIQNWNEDLMGPKDLIKSRIQKNISPTRTFRLRSYPLNLAASLLLLATVSYLFWISYTAVPKANYIEKETAFGQTSIIQLEDGSTIWLNSGSKVIYPEHFLGHSREIQLEGEAFFDIFPDSDRPFIVRTPKIKTTVLGTSFNIQAFEGESTEVTVSTGKVLVQKNHNTSSLNGELILYPNEQAILDNADSQFSKVQVNSIQFQSWRNGEYYLDQMTLEDFTKIMERKYGVTFIFHNSNLLKCQLSGRIMKQGLPDLLNLLSITMGLEYQIQGKRIHIYGSKC